MTYREALDYLGSFVNYEKESHYDYKGSFKLDRMRKLAALLGSPQKLIKSIHIAGSKGKGSTAVFVQSILKEAGFKTGLYTSPHLVSFRERIRINDSLISEEDVSRLLEKVKAAIDKLDDRPSFFEVYTAVAYLYFKENNTDFAVYEVGLGGRLDATNIIEPLVCAITPVSYEHMDILGHTLKEIAYEKAGIMKIDSICVVAPQDKEALGAIEDIAKEKNARLILVGKDILFKELKPMDESEQFSVFGIFDKYPLLETRLLGSHQIVNAATAIGVIEGLRLRGITIPAGAIRDGIKNARWEGRLEVMAKRPFIILDGAQNRASASSLSNAIKKHFRYKNLILVLGVSKDKDIRGILEELLPIAGSVILTKSRIKERACEPSDIKGFIDSKEKEVILTSSVEEALAKAVSSAALEDLVLITGSLFVVGEAREMLTKQYAKI